MAKISVKPDFGAKCFTYLKVGVEPLEQLLLAYEVGLVHHAD